jgi:hypothetical protein
VRCSIVYIAEAHAQDVWPISSARYSCDGRPVTVLAPSTTAERRQIAADFVRRYRVRLPVLVDGIDDAFERALAPWPLRFYVVDEDTGQLRYIAQPQACSYDLSKLRDWLLLATRYADNVAN